MLYQVGEAVAPPAELGGDRDHMGVFLARRSYWVGINYDWPEILYFSTEERAVDPEVAARLGIEGVHTCKETGGHGWRRKLNFECEEVYFYARKKTGQLQLLESFLRDCLATVQRIEVAGAVPGGPTSRVLPERQGR
jgi:hypothetical protein